MGHGKEILSQSETKCQQCKHKILQPNYPQITAWLYLILTWCLISLFCTTIYLLSLQTTYSDFPISCLNSLWSVFHIYFACCVKFKTIFFLFLSLLIHPLPRQQNIYYFRYAQHKPLDECPFMLFLVELNQCQYHFEEIPSNSFLKDPKTRRFVQGFD